MEFVYTLLKIIIAVTSTTYIILLKCENINMSHSNDISPKKSNEEIRKEESGTKRVFIKVKYSDSMQKELIHKFPEFGESHFQFGAKLAVQANQTAILVRDGHILDIFLSGNHSIIPDALPLLIDYAGEALRDVDAFKADMYFVNVKDFLDEQWVVKEPILVGNPSIGMTLLTASGRYLFYVSDPRQFVVQFARGDGTYNVTQDILNHFRVILLTNFQTVLSELCSKRDKSLLEIISDPKDISVKLCAKSQEDFKVFGVTLKQVFFESVRPSENSPEKLRAIGMLENLAEVDKFSRKSPEVSNSLVIHNYGTINNPQMQQSGANSSQEMIISAIPNDLETLLNELTNKVENMNRSLPEEIAQQVKQDLTVLKAEATSNTPRKQWYQLSADGLIKAAKNIGEIGKPVLELVARILPLLK